MQKTYFNWSSGKDSALALYYLLQKDFATPDLLLTTINKEVGRVSMHGLREDLLDFQAKSIGLPLSKIYLPGKISMEAYSLKMQQSTLALKEQGYTHAAFGDIFLEDLKAYREEQLEQVGLKAIFPLWEKDTTVLINEFLSLGYKAITVSVNAKLLGKEFVGRAIDHKFLEELPATVDPCGENGEFHTFVFDGPIFKQPVDFKIGEKVLKSYSSENTSEDTTWDTTFWYCDLLSI